MNNPENLRSDRPDRSVILVAEDDVLVQNIVRLTLERNGYFVLTAENGEEALYLSHCYPGKIDLLLTDVVMPKMNGIQLSSRLVEDRPGIIVLLMSGSFDEPNPGFPVLRKPFGMDKLIQAVNRQLEPLHRS